MLAIEKHCLALLESSIATDAAHDKAHILRVVKTTKHLCNIEQADPSIVIPAAWLHDCITVPKNHPDRSKSSVMAADHALTLLAEWQYPEQYYSAIHHAIATHSFSANIPPETLEAKIVQDADRLDALGAIGVSRCLQISGVLGSTLYSDDDPFCEQRTPNDKAFTVDHFYTKLFRIAETLHTQAAKDEAQQRVAFMRDYLIQLQREI